jgi:hypothetical protein
MTRTLYYLPVLLVALGCGSPPTPPSTTAKPQQPFDPVGHWKLVHTDGSLFYITLRADGTGRSHWEKGSDGKWRFEGDRLICSWEDGWTDVITRQGDGFVKIAYEKGRKPEGTPTNGPNKAEKVDNLPPKIDIR